MRAPLADLAPIVLYLTILPTPQRHIDYNFIFKILYGFSTQDFAWGDGNEKSFCVRKCAEKNET